MSDSSVTLVQGALRKAAAQLSQAQVLQSQLWTATQAGGFAREQCSLAVSLLHDACAAEKLAEQQASHAAPPLQPGLPAAQRERERVQAMRQEAQLRERAAAAAYAELKRFTTLQTKAQVRAHRWQAVSRCACTDTSSARPQEVTAACLEVEQLEASLQRLRTERTNDKAQLLKHEKTSEDAAHRALQAEANAQRGRLEGLYEQATLSAASAAQLHRKARDADCLAQAAGIRVEEADAEMAMCEQRVNAARARAAEHVTEMEGLEQLAAAAAQVSRTRSPLVSRDAGRSNSVDCRAGSRQKRRNLQPAAQGWFAGPIFGHAGFKQWREAAVRGCHQPHGC